MVNVARAGVEVLDGDTGASTVRVVIALEHHVLREGLRSLLAAEPRVEILGLASDADALIEIAGRTRPDVVLCGLTLSGSATVAAIRACVGAAPVLLLYPRGQRPATRPLIDLGVRGTVPDDQPVDRLVAAIRAVARGGIAHTPGPGQAPAEGSLQPPALTGREGQVLDLIARGNSNGQIAAALGIAAKTVDWHRRALSRKLGAHNTGELLMRAIRARLLTP